MGRLFLSLVLLFVTGCAQRNEQDAPPVDLDAERAAILAADAAWLAAAQAGDLESTLGFWAEDARVIAPGQAPYIGREAIRQMLAGGFATPGFSVSWQTSDVVVAPSGDVAWSFGTNEFIVPDAATGSADTLRGQGVVVWQKGADGRWRSVVDTWTPVAPPAGAGTAPGTVTEPDGGTEPGGEGGAG